MKKFIRMALIVIISLACFGFAGNTSITFNERKYGVMQMNTVTIELFVEEERNLNDGALMTLENYLEQFCKYSELSVVRSVSGDSVIYTIVYAGVYESPKARNETGYEAVTDKGFFLNKITVSRINPLKLMFDEIQTGTYSNDSFAAWLVDGIKDENGDVILASLFQTFPSLALSDAKSWELSYEMTHPIWYASSNAPSQNDLSKQDTCVWTKAANEDFGDDKITYSYYVPNTVSWAISVGILSFLSVGVLFLISRFKKEEKPSLADYRGLDEYSLNAELEKDKTSVVRSKMTEIPPDGYQGNGVFSENGKIYDVFGNECYFAPVPRDDVKKTEDDNDLPDIFGN